MKSSESFETALVFEFELKDRECYESGLSKTLIIDPKRFFRVLECYFTEAELRPADFRPGLLAALKSAIHAYRPNHEQASYLRIFGSPEIIVQPIESTFELTFVWGAHEIHPKQLTAEVDSQSMVGILFYLVRCGIFEHPEFQESRIYLERLTVEKSEDRSRLGVIRSGSFQVA